MSPGLTRHEALAGHEGGEADLQRVGAATDGVGGVAVVGTLAVETEVARGRDEEGLQQVSLRQTVDISGTTTLSSGGDTERERDLPRNVEDSAGDGDGSSESHNLIQMVGGHLCVVSLVVGEVEVVGQSLLGPREPHRLQHSLTSVIKGDDQLQLRPAFFLLHT